MKDNKGLTLLEVVLAIFILTTILFAGSGIYLSGMNLVQDAHNSAQAYRNAQIVMMHIEKNVRESASEFVITNPGPVAGSTLQFRTYGAMGLGMPSVDMQYSFDPSSRTITFQSGATRLSFRHINACEFRKEITDGVVLEISVEGLDNRDRLGYRYRLNTNVEAIASTSPAVFSGV